MKGSFRAVGALWRGSFFGGTALVALAAFGCESTPAPVAPVATPPPAQVAAPELGPAAEPGDIVAIARWKNPLGTLANLSGCSKLPPMLAQGGSKALLELAFGEALRGEVDAHLLADVLVLDAPVDAAVVLDKSSRRPKPIAAFSIGLSSFDAAKSAVEATGTLTEIAPGVFKIGDKRRDLACVLANATGPTPARLVCGAKDKDVAAIAPWLARTVPTLSSGAQDLHAEFRWTPIDARFGEEIRQNLKGAPMLAGTLASTGQAKLDAAISEGAGMLANELGALASDVDTVNLDLSVDATNCLTTDLSLKFRGRASWLVQTMTDRPERQGAPPAIFWRAPKESESAYYGRGGDPARMVDGVRVLRALAEGGLLYKGFSAADAKAVSDILTVVTPKDANTVSASGHLDTPAPNLAKAKPQQMMDALAATYLGWYLIGVDDGGEAMTKWFKDAVAAYNRPGVQKSIGTHLGSNDQKKLPQIKIVGAPAPLGKGALDIQFSVSDLDPPETVTKAGGKPEKVSITGHLLVMQDGKGAWIGVGLNRDELVKRLVASKSGAPDTGTLAARSGLDPLKNGKYFSGGFMTLQPLTKSMVSGLNMYFALSGVGAQAPVAKELVTALENPPHKGQTPIFLGSTVAGGDAPRIDLTVNITKDTFEDFGSFVSAGIKIAQQMGAGLPFKP